MSNWYCQLVCQSVPDRATGDALAADLVDTLGVIPGKNATLFHEPKAGKPTTWGTAMAFACYNEELRSKLCKLSKGYSSLQLTLYCEDKADFWKEEIHDGHVRFATGVRYYEKPSPWVTPMYRLKAEMPLYPGSEPRLPVGMTATVIKANENGAIWVQIGSTIRGFTKEEFDSFFEEVR